MPNVASSNESRDFVKIKNEHNLYYNKDTKIVYYICQGYAVGYDNLSYSYMSPYIAENGLPYIYQDGELKMIQRQEEEN